MLQEAETRPREEGLAAVKSRRAEDIGAQLGVGRSA